MGAGHSHRADRRSDDAAVEVRGGPRRVLLGLLAVVGVLTVVGLVLLWPDQAKVDEVGKDVRFAAPGVTFPRAHVESVQPACPPVEGPTGETFERPGEADACGRMTVTVLEGAEDGRVETFEVPPHVAESGLDSGDVVRVMRIPGAEGDQAHFTYFGTERTQTLWILGAFFVVVVVAVARLRGLFALLGLGFSAWMILTFVLPAVLGGESALLVGLVASSAIMFVVLYTTHGFSIRTSAALAGTLVGIGLTAAIGAWSVHSTHLTGIGDEGGGVLQSIASDLDFQGLLTCAVMIAGLGVLNDVTITQSSSVWELRAASPTMTRRALFGSGMRIGRDHIASTIYTIAFAYTGTALMLLLLLQLYGLPTSQLLATEQITQEVVRTLATSIGLVLAVPLTTAIAAALVPPAREPSDEVELDEALV